MGSELVSCDKCVCETTTPFAACGALLLAIPGSRSSIIQDATRQSNRGTRAARPPLLLRGCRVLRSVGGQSEITLIRPYWLISFQREQIRYQVIKVLSRYIHCGHRASGGRRANELLQLFGRPLVPDSVERGARITSARCRMT